MKFCCEYCDMCYKLEINYVKHCYTKKHRIMMLWLNTGNVKLLKYL